MEISDTVYERITELSERGSSALEQGNNPGAIALFNEAVDLLPRPVTQWDAAVWLFASIGDAYFEDDDHSNAIDAYRIALASSDGNENPYVHLRIGQCLFQLGEHDDAANHLTIAYMMEGKEIFEPDPPEYLKFLKTHIRVD